ncbi:MAG TPA: NapH/MauN family ferredoxin-type protein [Sedimenticola sp.]|nr:NapH/MauN family ferredoxin-type protein [Sedimenticola sp.]
MSYIVDSLRLLLGGAPRKPEAHHRADEVNERYTEKRKTRLTKEALRAKEAEHRASGKHVIWRRRRWATLIFVNLLFVVSYYFDVQLLEGALTASRFVGFHMADLNSALQVTLAFKHVVLNLVIGTVTVFVLWLLLGGRTFCSWVCPYHLLAEWAESLHLWLARKKIVKDHKFNRKVRTLFYVLFALLALVTGYTVFETLSPTGILSRALIYGPGVALVWVALLLLFEIFYSRRAWCRYVCPIGVTYGVVGLLSPVRVKYNMVNCHHEGDCRAVCLVPHVLDVTIRGRATKVDTDLTADCTRCGLCVDICPTDSLNFTVKGLDKHL